jgi:transcriptional regulator with XRE-family HTH domain
MLNIGDRLRLFREQKGLTQGDIEEQTAVLRTYISRVENGYSIPSLATVEKFARALKVPMYQLFYDGEEPPKLPNLPKRKSAGDVRWGDFGKDARMLNAFCHLFNQMKERDLGLLLHLAQDMTKLS